MSDFSFRQGRSEPIDDIAFELAAFDGVETPGPDVRVLLIDPDGSTCRLDARDGSVRLSHSDDGSHELILRSNSRLVADWLIGDCGGSPTLPPIEVAGVDQEFRPIFPIDVAGPCDVVERVEGADAVVQQIISASPIGTIHYVDTFVDGALRTRRYGIEADPDVVVRKNFAQSVRSLNPGLTLLERITGNQVTARDVPSLEIVAGLYDIEEFRAWLNYRSEVNELLVKLSMHRPVFAQASTS